jgi:hypothetical protein
MFTVDKSAGCLEIGATFLSTLAYGHDKRQSGRFAGALIVQCVFKALDDRRYDVVPEALRLVCLIDRAGLEKDANARRRIALCLPFGNQPKLIGLLPPGGDIQAETRHPLADAGLGERGYGATIWMGGARQSGWRLAVAAGVSRWAHTSANGEPIPAWIMHDLRRSTATGLAGLGVNLPVIERCLNHIVRSSVSSTSL